MPMDSLMIAHDSTFMGWYRMEAGSDSMNFNLMNQGGMNGGSMMMQFAMSLKCQFHWDSLMSDSAHRRWHLTGIKGWNGTSWVAMAGVSISGNVLNYTSSQNYSAVAFVGTKSVTQVETHASVPVVFALAQNYPNPFNPSTNITYTLPQSLRIRLEVYNILGEKVQTLVDGLEKAGIHAVKFDGLALPSGVYFYRLMSGTFVQTNKMTLVK